MFTINKRHIGGSLRLANSSNDTNVGFSLRRADTTTLQQGISVGNLFNRMAPVVDRLGRGTVVHDWIPQSTKEQNELARKIYMTDPVCGSAIDFYKEVPFGGIILGGMKDNKRLQFYEDALDALDLTRYMPFLAGDFLTIGRLITHLIFDSTKGYFTDLINHNSDWINITPSPIMGQEPLIDLMISPEHRKWATSTDPRVMEQKKSVSPKLIKLLASGSVIALPPENTIFVTRKMTTNDDIGTSIYIRVLVLLAIEYAYINSEVCGLRRRSAPITTATMGIENVWDPSPEEMQEMHDMLMATEEDPVGAKLVLRNGIDLNSFSGHSEIAKYGEQYGWLKEAKLQALGMNEAFASGEATLSYLESMLSLGMERIRNFRNFMTTEYILHGVVEPLARMHGHYKRSKAEIDHRIRTSAKNKQNLDLPTIEWTRSLKPGADRDYVDLLQTLEDKGIPITLRQWAQAGGYDIDESLHNLKADIELRSRIKSEWGDKKKKFVITEEEEESVVRGSVNTRNALNELSNYLVHLPIWKENNVFIDLRKGDIIRALNDATNVPDNKNWRLFRNTLKNRFNWNDDKIDTFRYLLTRCDTLTKKLPPRIIVKVRDFFLKNLGRSVPDRKFMQEIEWLNVQLEKVDPDWANRDNTVSDKSSSPTPYNELLVPPGSSLLTGVLSVPTKERIQRYEHSLKSNGR